MKAYQIKNPTDAIPLEEEGINPIAQQLPFPTLINVKGRKEHESILKDPEKMKELGLDLYYETMVYLNRWGGWLRDEST